MVVSGHHIHALRWGPQASRKWSWRADIYDEKAMPGREAARMSGYLRGDPSAWGAGGRLFGTGWRVGRQGSRRRNLPYRCAHGGLRVGSADDQPARTRKGI